MVEGGKMWLGLICVIEGRNRWMSMWLRAEMCG